MKPLFSLILLERWIEIENLIKQKIVSQFEVQIKNSFLGLLNPIWPCIVRFLMVLHQKQDVNKILVSKLENFIYLTTKFDDWDHTNIYHKEEVPEGKMHFSILFSTSTLTLFMPKGKRRGASFLDGMSQQNLMTQITLIYIISKCTKNEKHGFCKSLANNKKVMSYVMR